MLNHITIMGRLTRDPDYRTTGSGISVANFSVAVDRDFSGKDGGEKETDFIDCVAWRKTAEFLTKYFSKGSMIAVSGRLQIRSWTDDSGNKRRTAEAVADNIYFAGSRKAAAEEPASGSQTFAAPKLGFAVPIAPTDSDFAMPDGGDANLPF